MASVSAVGKASLKGLAKLLYGSAALAFLFLDRVLSTFTKVKIMSALVEGIGVAVILGMLGFAVDRAADRIQNQGKVTQDKNGSPHK